MTLHQLLQENKYDTDKESKHGYISFYEHYLSPFRDQKINLLEIGIWKGGSIRLWSDYFSTASITGLDISEETINNFGKPPPQATLLEGDSTDRETIHKHFRVNQFDIIIHDGNHTLSNQILSFCSLYPMLKPGGLFFIEDIIPEALALESLKGLAKSTFHFPHKSSSGDSILMVHRKDPVLK